MIELFNTYLIESFLFICLFIFFNLKVVQNKLANYKFYFGSLVAVILIQIISVAFLKKEVGDVGLFAAAGWYLAHHQDIYFIDSFHTQYPFFPFLIFLHAILQKLWEIFPQFTFSFYLKIILLLALHGLGKIIQKFHQKKNLVVSRAYQLQFVSSPIAYFIVLFHGQIDILLLLCLVLALIQFNEKSRLVIGGILYAMAIAIKTWPVFFGLFIFKILKNWPNRFLVGLIVITFLFLDIFIYTRLAPSSFTRVLPAVFQAGGPVGIWGITLILETFIPNLIKYDLLKFVFLFALLEILIIRIKLPIWKASFLTILALYLTMPRWGIQYLIWLQPFLFLIRSQIGEKKFRLFILISTCYLFIAYGETIFGIYGQNLQSPGLNYLIGFVLYLYIAYLFFSQLKDKQFLTHEI